MGCPCALQVLEFEQERVGYIDTIRQLLEDPGELRHQVTCEVSAKTVLEIMGVRAWERGAGESTSPRSLRVSFTWNYWVIARLPVTIETITWTTWMTSTMTRDAGGGIEARASPTCLPRAKVPDVIARPLPPKRTVKTRAMEDGAGGQITRVP